MKIWVSFHKDGYEYGIETDGHSRRQSSVNTTDSMRWADGMTLGPMRSETRPVIDRGRRFFGGDHQAIWQQSLKMQTSRRETVRYAL